MLGDYRVAEFGCTLAMLLVAKSFTLMAVNDRPIPRIEIRLNSTTTIYARDPTVDERKLHEQGGVPPQLMSYVDHVLN